MIKTYTEAQDTVGEAIKTYQNFQQWYAKVEPLSGTELEIARQVQAEVTHRITGRYFPGIKPTMLYQWNSRTFEFLSVLNMEERNEEIQIMAKEKV